MYGIALVFLLLFLPGCGTVGNPALLDDSILSQIQSGRSTKTDVAALLGKPTVTSVSSIGTQKTIETWAYSYSHVETNPILFVPIVNLIAIACCEVSSSESRTFSVSFDGDVVQSVHKGDYSTSIRPGEGSTIHSNISTVAPATYGPSQN